MTNNYYYDRHSPYNTELHRAFFLIRKSRYKLINQTDGLTDQGDHFGSDRRKFDSFQSDSNFRNSIYVVIYFYLLYVYLIPLF